MEKILPDNFTEAIGWTIFHSIWQIAVVAALLGILLISLGKFSAQLRYFIASASYIFILAIGVYTFANNYHQQKEIVAGHNLAESTVATENTNNWIVPEIMQEEQEAVPFLKEQLQVVKSFFSQHFAIIAMIWVLGIMFFSLKFLGNLVYLQRMKNYRVIQLSKKWQDKMVCLKDKLEISKKVKLLQSSLAKVPLVIGYFKPVILMPLSALSGLSAKEIECIIAHELAHIKRNDYIINILQKIVEILFFYHPAVWWISSVIKMERENCCDDIAVSLTGDSVNFVKALANMEEKRLRSEHLAVAFSTSKNQLLKRVQRILNQRKMKSNFSEGFIASCVIFLGFLTIAFSTGFTPGEAVATTLVPEEIKEITVEVKDTIKNDDQYNTLKNLEEGKVVEKKEKKENLSKKEQEYVVQREIKEKQKEEELKRAKLELEKAHQQLIEAEKKFHGEQPKLSEKELDEIVNAKQEWRASIAELERAKRKMHEAEEKIAIKEQEKLSKKEKAELKKAKQEIEKAHQELVEAEKEFHVAPPNLSEKEIAELAKAREEWQASIVELERAKSELQTAHEESEREQRRTEYQVQEETRYYNYNYDDDDLDDIIEEAMENVEEAFEDIDEDEIADAIEDAMESVSEAFEEIDFDAIYDQISDAVRDISAEIDVDEIMVEVREGLRDARYEVRTHVHGDDDYNIRSEHVSKITEGVDAWNEWRRNNPGLIPQLGGATLYDFDLTGINFEEANLNGAQLKEINLTNANLFNAQLRGANLKEANLTGAILREASFNSTEMKEAILKNTDARHASFRYANLREADLTNADLREADLTGVDLSEATIKDTKFKDAKASKNTSFPEGFDAEKEGVIIR